MDNNTFTITEFKEIKKEELNNINISFNLLRDFVEEHNSILSFSRKGVIKARNFVGIIELSDGGIIEILPKITNVSNVNYIREIFIKMLLKSKIIEYKNIGDALLNSRKLPLLEVFAHMFLNEVSLIIKRGLKRDYVLVEGNEKYIKGKILWNKHIRKNFIHKERFYVNYDNYEFNNSANKLIKSTLLYLNKKDFSPKTKRRVKQYLFVFDEVEESKNIMKDFFKANSQTRILADYKRVIQWCNIFLKNRSFEFSHNNTIGNAILFPMEKVFEKYIAYIFQTFFINYNINIQESKYTLFSSPNKFKIKPDIVIRHKIEKKVIIIDTKWKILSDDKEDKEGKVSQGDLYQMYAYANKYYEKEEKYPLNILIYPKNPKFDKLQEWKYSDNLKLFILPVDLSKIIEENGEEKFVKLLKSIEIF